MRAPHGDERAQVDALITAHWGDGVARLGELQRLTGLPAVVAVDSGAIAGVLTYAISDGACEVVSLQAVPPGRGAGWVLMDAVRAEALATGCRRLWLITTNDNTRALRFYQRWGMDLVAVHHDAVTRARHDLKPAIPLTGDDGIPLRHELELEVWLSADH